jgi:hypothetical protein
LRQLFRHPQPELGLEHVSGIHGCIKQLISIHFAKTLVTLLLDEACLSEALIIFTKFNTIRFTSSDRFI